MALKQIVAHFDKDTPHKEIAELTIKLGQQGLMQTTYDDDDGCIEIHYERPPTRNPDWAGFANR